MSSFVPKQFNPHDIFNLENNDIVLKHAVQNSIIGIEKLIYGTAQGNYLLYKGLFGIFFFLW